MNKFLVSFLLLIPLSIHAQATWQMPASAVPSPAFSCGSTIGFGNQLQSTTSGQLAVTCTNTGNVSLTVTSEVLSGSTFSLGSSNTCIATLVLIPSGTCLVVAQFTPPGLTSYTGSVVVTITGATGSPQTVALSGTGVSSGGGSGYTAPTAAAGALSYTGYVPLSSSNLPAEGGTIAEDQNFVHCVPPWSAGCSSTSASAGGISGSQYGAFIQCAGSAANITANALWSGHSLSASWRTNNTTTAHIITPDDKWIVLTSSSTDQVFFQINFTSGSSKCTLAESINPTNTPVTPAQDGPTASHTGGSDADLFYTVNATSPGISTMNFSGGAPATITSLVSNLNSLSSAVCGISLGTNSNSYGYMRTTNDTTSLGHDNTLIFAAGTNSEGQNNWECLVFYQRSSGAVAWWDTLTDTCGSTTSPAWGGGWKSGSGCTGVTGGRIHGLEEPDATGTYVGVDDTANANGIPTFFDIATQTVSAPTTTSLPSGGHGGSVGPWFLVFSSGATGSSSSGAMNGVLFTNMLSLAVTAARLGTAPTGGTYQTDQHDTGANVNSTATTGTTYSLGYTQASQCPGGSSPCPQPTGIGQQEGIMVTSPPSSGTWTPTFYRFFHSMVDAVTDQNFYAAVGGNIAQDGSMAAVTTNWGCSLGNDNLSQCRKVVNIYELR
jgi:hypothetical protein